MELMQTLDDANHVGGGHLSDNLANADTAR
jgi:hypothetical protein